MMKFAHSHNVSYHLNILNIKHQKGETDFTDQQNCYCYLSYFSETIIWVCIYNTVCVRVRVPNIYYTSYIIDFTINESDFIRLLQSVMRLPLQKVAN